MSKNVEDKWKEYFRIHENFNHMNQMMIREIELASVQGGVTGNYREGMWVKFFRGIIPLKYSLTQGVIIIDSKGNVSKEVDIVIFDEQFTPYVFQYNSLKFIPIEAVVIAVECKSTSYSRKALLEWSDSIAKLETSRTGIARVLGGQSIGLTNHTQTRTRPLRILTTMKSVGENKQKEESMQQEEQNQQATQDQRKLTDVFDFVISEEVIDDSNPENKEFKVCVSNKTKSLAWWSRELNQVNVKNEEDENNKYLKLHQFSASALIDHPEIPRLLFELNDLKGKGKGGSEPPPKDQDKIENLTNRINMLAKEHLEKMYPELKFNSNLKLENTLEDLEVPGNSLLTLNLQINQLLMLLNNPMLFPHFAYANAFKKAIKKYRVGK